MSIEAIVKEKSEITHSRRQPQPIVLSTRIRLARNLDHFSFPGWAKEEQRQQILELCEEAVGRLPEFKDGSIFNCEDMGELERQVLVERHLISPELSEEDQGAGVIVGKDQSLALMINEEDHLRMQIVGCGLSFAPEWEKINRLDTELEEKLDFAFSGDLGYLTACPTNLGTGMRASAMMHLPGLVIGGEMERVIRAANQLGLAVRGLYGEGSDASGSVFQISNQQTLGESEDKIILRLSGVLKTIVAQEHNMRLRLVEQEPMQLFDKIGRAYGILLHAHFVTSAEAMNLLSLVRLGVDLNIFEKKCRRMVDRLFIELQPGHMQVLWNTKMGSDQRDEFRASWLAERFSTVTPPDFTHVGLQK